MASSPDSDDLLAPLAARTGELPSATCNRQIREACTKDLSACNTMSVTTRSLASFGLLLFVGFSLLLLSRHELSGFSAAALWGAMGWATLQAGVLFLGFGRRRSGSTARLRWLLALLVPVAFFAYLLLTSTPTGSFSEFASSSKQTQHAFYCGLVSFGIGALAALGISLLWRRTDPFTPRLSGSLAGLLGGLGAAVPIGLVCPGTDGWHVCFSHGVSLLLVVGLGAVLGRRWLSP